jgi:hemoglobin
MKTLMRRWSVYLVCGLALGWAGLVRAEEKPAAQGDQKALDQEMYRVLRDIHERGRALYNGGDPAGCYRMFQGGLLAIQAVASDHPDVQKLIEEGLARAEEQPSMSRRAFALHDLIEEVRAKVRPGVPKSLPPTANTLWDRLGGEAKVTQVIDDFTALAATDPKVDFTRGGKVKLTPEAVAYFKKEMVAFVSQATGGPLKYTGKGMKEVHTGMGITDAQFDASVADLRTALEKNQVKPADIDALLKLVEGTRKDIVEPAPTPPKTEEKKPEEKKSEEKSPEPAPKETKPEEKKP